MNDTMFLWRVSKYRYENPDQPTLETSTYEIGHIWTNGHDYVWDENASILVEWYGTSKNVRRDNV